MHVIISDETMAAGATIIIFAAFPVGPPPAVKLRYVYEACDPGWCKLVAKTSEPVGYRWGSEELLLHRTAIVYPLSTVSLYALKFSTGG